MNSLAYITAKQEGFGEAPDAMATIAFKEIVTKVRPKIMATAAPEERVMEENPRRLEQIPARKALCSPFLALKVATKACSNVSINSSVLLQRSPPNVRGEVVSSFCGSSDVTHGMNVAAGGITCAHASGKAKYVLRIHPCFQAAHTNKYLCT